MNPLADDKTASLLPPEFLAFGITKERFEPWTAVDCILTVRLMSFHLTWNWANDLQKLAMRQSHPDIADILEEVIPFTTDFLHDVVPIVDDEDLKQWGQYSDELLVNKYRMNADKVRRASASFPESKRQQDDKAASSEGQADQGVLDTPLLGE